MKFEVCFALAVHTWMKLYEKCRKPHPQIKITAVINFYSIILFNIK
jgi:hypothetical protein